MPIGSTQNIPFTSTVPTQTYVVRNETTHEKLTLLGFDIERLTEKAVDNAKIKVLKDSNISIGNEIKIFNSDGVTLFGGTDESVDEIDMWSLNCQGYGFELNNKWKVKIYENKSPEYIVEDLISGDSDLTYSSSTSSGITITKYVANNYISKIIEEMRVLLGWQIRTEPDKKFYFEPTGNIDNGVVLTTGVNIKIPKWDKNTEQLCNKIKVFGDFANYNTNESFNASASQTDFTLTFKPTSNVKVTVDGTEQTGNAQGRGAYDIDVDNKKIVFASGLTGGEAVIIYYTYQIPIVVEGQDDASITKYKTRYKEIQAPFLKTFQDARLYVSEYIRNNATPKYKTEIIISSIITSYSTGELITVIDNQRNINETLVIKSIRWLYPEGVTKIKVGFLNNDILDWQNEVMERTRELEKRVADENIINIYRQFNHDLRVGLTLTLTKKSRAINDSFILGHSSNGVLGTSLLGGRQSSWTTL